MKSNTNLLEADKFYHIYNRGINGENIFKEARNYHYFLKLYSKYILSIADTFAYCLLPNHFHIFLKIHSEAEITDNTEKNVQSISHHVGNQFAKLFNSYSQALNKSKGRTGSLFEHPFRRKSVERDEYITKLIWYIHFNPEKPRIVKEVQNLFDARGYSSFKESTGLAKEAIRA